MSIAIKIVPHPGRRQVVINKRLVHYCPKCKDPGNQYQQNRVVEPEGHRQWQKVTCDLCQGPCEPLKLPFIHDQCGIEVEGQIVGLCHNGPNGFISPTLKGVDAAIWHEVKRAVDKRFGGSAILHGYPPTFEDHMPEAPADDDDDTDLEESD